jgi:hypothetical protein
MLLATFSRRNAANNLRTVSNRLFGMKRAIFPVIPYQNSGALIIKTLTLTSLI